MNDIGYYRHDNDRTAGNQANQYKSVQSWKTKKLQPQQAPTQLAQQQIINNLEKAAQGKVGRFDVELENSMAYANAGEKIATTSAPSPKEGFQFEDVVDVINPLQHLPIVGMVYRGITGDKLHPMSQIIGGAIYGGPVGAVTGTVNAISQVQTGKDIGEHALEMAGITSKTENSPMERLNKTATALNQGSPLEELPGSALSFVNLSEPNKAYERVKIADGRTAGSMIVQKQMVGYRQSINTAPLSNIARMNEQSPIIDTEHLPAREEITSIQIAAMPPRQGV